MGGNIQRTGRCQAGSGVPLPPPAAPHEWGQGQLHVQVRVDSSHLCSPDSWAGSRSGRNQVGAEGRGNAKIPNSGLSWLTVGKNAQICQRGSDGLQSFAFDSLSVTSTWTASYCYALATNGAARYMMAHHRTGCPKHRPVLMCAMVWGTLLHSRVMDPSSVLLQWNP